MLSRGRMFLPAAVILAVVTTVVAAARPRAVIPGLQGTVGRHETTGFRGPAARLDAIVAARAAGPSGDGAAVAVADDLTVLRRTWLALAGTIPSLEEIRRYEADTDPDRLDRWLAMLLADRRVAEHLAEILADVLTGTDGGPPFVFRRDRLTAWLADALHAGRPFDEVVRQMVTGTGLWTGSPAVNFVTQAAANERVDENTLAGRVARTMLGLRLDCAQCHDHPFAPWTQGQFEGLAACFAEVRLSPLGVRDTAEADGPTRRVPPRAPFATEVFPPQGRARERLADWLTHPVNRRFERAVANRCWTIAFGKPWHDPIDDVPDPADAPRDDDLLDALGGEFRAGGRDLLRTLGIICSTNTFRRPSTHPDLDDESRARLPADAWTAFPLSQLSPRQMISAMVQAGSMRTIDPASPLLVRTVRFLRTIDFTREYGVAGPDAGEPATIPQALVRMNGRLTRELTKADAVSGPGRIAGLAATDEARIEATFLACLTRRPTAVEREASRALLRDTPGADGVEDLAWALFNTAEFSWNH